MVRHIRRNVVAYVALVFAFAGTASAASSYIITSKHQIKPSVLHALKGNRGPRGFAGMQGAPGSAGIANIQDVSSSTPICGFGSGSCDVVSATATCPAGSSSLVAEQARTRSRPRSPPTQD